MLRVAFLSHPTARPVVPIVLPNFAAYLSQLPEAERGQISAKFSLAENGNIGEAGRILDHVKTPYPDVEDKLHSEAVPIITSAQMATANTLVAADERAGRVLGQRILAAVKTQIRDEKSGIKDSVYDRLGLTPGQKKLFQFSRNNPQFCRFLISACCGQIIQCMKTVLEKKGLLTEIPHALALNAISDGTVDPIPLPSPELVKLAQATMALTDSRSRMTSSVAKLHETEHKATLGVKARLTPIVDELVAQLIAKDPTHARDLINIAYEVQAGAEEAKSGWDQYSVENPLSALITELEARGHITAAMFSDAVKITIKLASLLAAHQHPGSHDLWRTLGASGSENIDNIKRLEYAQVAHDMIQESFRQQLSTAEPPVVSSATRNFGV